VHYNHAIFGQDFASARPIARNLKLFDWDMPTAL